MLEVTQSTWGPGKMIVLSKTVTRSVQDVKAALADVGLDPELAQPISGRAAASRSLKQLKHKGLIEELKKSESDGDTCTSWQLSERFYLSERIDYTQLALITYDPDTERITCTDSELTDVLQTKYNLELGMFTAARLTQLVIRLFERQRGILPLRSQGAVYFVPNTQYELLEKVRAFLQLLGGGMTAGTIGFDDKLSCDQVLEQLVARVQDNLQKIKEQHDKWKDEGKTITPDMAANAIGKIKGEIERVRQFATALKKNGSSILTQAQSQEIDLGLAAGCDVDVLASFAVNGHIEGTLAELAVAAMEGQSIPTIEEAQAAQLNKMGAIPDLSDAIPTDVVPDVAPVPDVSTTDVEERLKKLLA